MKANRKWVIPDLHGCIKTLQALIENHIRPSKNDELYFLGDYIDRNYNPKAVLDYIIWLEEHGFNIFPLRGNHEEYLLMAWESAKKQKKTLFFRKESNPLLDQWLRHGGKHTLRSFGLDNFRQIPERYINWLSNLKFFYIVDDYVIVHAGLNFSRRDPLEDTHAMLWSGSFKAEPEKINNKTIIHGHVPVSLGFLQKVLHQPNCKVIPLDNGCYLAGTEGMGNLVALELGTRQLIIQPCVD
jgi:serine/threonine protein phosphatase 1